MAELRDKVFENTDELDLEALTKYKLKSIEDIEKDLVEFGGWDTASQAATVALKMRNNNIDQCILHLVGETDPKRMDAKTVFGDGYTGGSEHQVRVGKVDLQKFCSQGKLVSNWLSPQQFLHCV